MASKQVVAYTDDNGVTYKCALTAATIAAQPTVPATGPFEVALFATVNESRRKYGVHCRYLNLSRNIGTVAAPNLRHAKLPVMKLADMGTLETAGTVDYAGSTWTVSSPTGEKRR